MLLDQHSAKGGQNNQLEKEAEWLRSKSIRALLNISPASVQNLRISGKVRYRKVMGSYYYNRTDIMKLFGDDKK
nr:helix-turn-helix domain-containing protein [Chryseobacterium populi]